MPSPKLTPLDEAERAELEAWLAEHAESLPLPVRAALEQHHALCEGLRGSRHKLSQVLVELRRALGIIAASERRLSGDPLGPLSNGDRARPKSERARLELDAERFDTLSAWHKELAKQTRAQAQSRQEEADEDARSTPSSARTRSAKKRRPRTRPRCASTWRGSGWAAEAQPAFESSKEAFMTGAQVATSEETVALPAPVDEKRDGKVLDTMVEERERFDFSFEVKRLTLQVEKKVVQAADGERRVVSASTASFGPRGYAVTWGFLAHMVVLVVQYAMPMNRLATLLSTDAKRFSAGALARMLRYVAHRFAPIYLALFDSLADSEILCGDDTSCRVTEVSRHLGGAGGGARRRPGTATATRRPRKRSSHRGPRAWPPCWPPSWASSSSGEPATAPRRRCTRRRSRDAARATTRAASSFCTVAISAASATCWRRCFASAVRSARP